MRWRYNFTFTTWQIRSYLLCKFLSTRASLSSFSSIFRIFRQREMNCRASSKIGNICNPRKERVKTCKDYVIGREITTALKIVFLSSWRYIFRRKFQIKTITSSEISQWWCNRRFRNGYISDGAIRGLNSSCVVIFVSCCATGWSGDFVSIATI